MATIWQTLGKRSSSTTGRLYNVAGLNYDVAGILYQGSYAPTTWAFINKSS